MRPSVSSSPSETTVAPIEISLTRSLKRLMDELGLDELGLAQALGANRPAVQRWMQGSYPQYAVRERLAALVALHAQIYLTFKNVEGARAWLATGMPYLGGAKPIGLIRTGQFAQVEAALEAINSGFAS